MNTEAEFDQEPGKVAKVIQYIVILFAWFIIGRLFTIGPQVAHNIEKAVGKVALYGTTMLWAILPVTYLVYLVHPVKNTKLALITNFVAWIVFLIYFYIR